MTEVTAERRSLARDLGLNAISCLGYLLVSGAMMVVAPRSEFPPFCLAFGFSFALLVHSGLRVLPGVAIASVVVGYHALGSSLLLGLTYSLVLCAELAVLERVFRRQFRGIEEALCDVSGVYRYVLVIGGLVLGAASLAAVAILAALGAWSGVELWVIWPRWWASELLGILILTPFILIWTLPRREVWGFSQMLHAVLAFAALCFGGYLVFSSSVAQRSYPVGFLPLPLIGWIILKLGRRAGLSALLVTALYSTWATQLGVGPFSGERPIEEYFFILQVFLFVTALTMVTLVAVREESRRALDQSRASEERLRQVLENMPVMMSAHDRDGNILAWNRECERVTGYSEEDLVGVPGSLDLLYPCPEQRQELFEEKRILEGNYRGMDWPLVTRSGQSRMISWSNISREHPVPGWASWAIGVDITDRLRAETGQQEFQKRLIAIWDSIHEGIFTCRRDGRLGAVNPAFLDIFHCDEATALQSSVVDFLGAEGLERFEAFSSEPGLGQNFPFELECRRRDGSKVELECSLGSFRIQDETYFTGTVRDIGLRKNLERMSRERHRVVQEELHKARDELIEKTRLATIGQIAFNVAHELRNPLMAIKTATYYLRREDSLDEVKLEEILELIDENVEGAGKYIQDLLDFTNTPRPRPELIDLEACLDEVQAMLPSSEVEVVRQLETLEVHADPEHLKTILRHLITNALQAQEDRGRVIISAHATGDRDILEIADEGPGVSGEIALKMFEPLFTTKARGAGLGLVICRQMIEAHGGTIEHLRRDGGGAWFRIELPGKSRRSRLPDLDREPAELGTESRWKEWS